MAILNPLNSRGLKINLILLFILHPATIVVT